ncbi:hypothetical protein ACNSOL_12235 (plasmid) [Aliarcobacter lanthieri]|uniref:hypothetical protein n=1 Tax=Aliarcobacter lanthieri TaxID=1355374 RepID=UPI003AAF7487
MDLKNPNQSVYDFTYESKETKKERTVERILVEIGKSNLLERRESSIYSCKYDELGNEYCPSNLVKADSYWDYEDGYSVKGVGQVVDYTSKENTSYNTSMNFQSVIATNESKMCTQIGSYCSGENGTCSFSGTKMIAFGANGNYVYKFATSSIGCNHNNFGDPAPNVVKSCYIVNQAEMINNTCPSGYIYLEWIGCAGENNTCYVDGIKTVRYGTSGYYSYKTINNSVYCSNTVFGDPILGSVKTCSFKNTTIKQVSTLTATCPPNTTDKNIWLTCSSEGGTCSFNGTQVVRYGGDGKYYYKNNVNGTIKCDNNTFGDPAPGAIKGCSYSQGMNCEGKKLECSVGYTETTGTEISKGECKKTQEYTYYNYLCNNSKNEQGYNYTPTNSGGNCNKIDTNNTTANPELTTPCNNSTPPTNNCKREGFKCNTNERKAVYVDNEWRCSPYLCNGDMRCGYGTCKEGTKASKDKYQDLAYHPLKYLYAKKCNSGICDYVENKDISYCEREACPQGEDIIQQDGRCYKIECPKGTYLSGTKCLESNY